MEGQSPARPGNALTWEIDAHRDEIFEKLLRFFKQQKRDF
jgi:hypothetical protein